MTTPIFSHTTGHTRTQINAAKRRNRNKPITLRQRIKVKVALDPITIRDREAMRNGIVVHHAGRKITSEGVVRAMEGE